jgi:outer membrane protein assembly factor BamB
LGAGDKSGAVARNPKSQASNPKQIQIAEVQNGIKPNTTGNSSMRISKKTQLFPQARSIVAGALLLSMAGVAGAADGNWPQFRGPRASGVSGDSAPVNWNVESGQNIRWQTPIPGMGHASPIIWRNRLYVATVVKPGGKADLKVGLYGDIDSYKENEVHQWRLLCLDKTTGKVLWDKLELEAVPRTERHTKASHCNSTPATDGQHIVAVFGSEGLFCYDMEGKQLWHKDLGRMQAGYYIVTNTSWGFGSSPILYEGKVIVQCDVLSEQYLAVFDVRDARQLWRTPRQEVPTWCTPIVAASAKRTQIVVNGWKEIGGYDLATGRQLWHLQEGGDVPVASPILTPDYVILTSAHGRARPMRAVRLDAAGDITPSEIGATNQAIAWSYERQGDYLQTPILVGQLLWGTLDGIITCFDVQSGQIQYHERIGNGSQGFTASPVAAHGNLYFTGELGDVFVLPATNQFSVLATNKLGGLCLSTPAISEGTLYFRTVEKLVAIGSSK